MAEIHDMKPETVAPDQPRGDGLLRLAWLPVPLLAAAMVALWLADLRTAHESPLALHALSAVFSTGASLLVAVLIGRSFLLREAPGLLLLGCGVALWGAAGTACPFLLSCGVNATVTVHGSLIWLAAWLQLAGAVLLLKPRRAPQPAALTLALAYAGSLGLVWLVTALALRDWLPVFFVPGQGGTWVRHLTLGSAALVLGCTAALLWSVQRRRPSAFVHWYGLALTLVAIGLLGVMLEPVQGGALSWTARAAQFLGGGYLLVAAIAAARESGGWRVSLEEAFRQSEERCRVLFDNMTEGFALHEIVADRDGRPRDFRFLDVNPAFERLTGLRREAVVGRLRGEVLPGDDPDWARLCGQVALTGQPVHFDSHSPVLGRHYGVYAYRPAPRQLAVIITDVTERRQTELALRQYRECLEELVRERTAEVRKSAEALDAERRRFHEILDALPAYIVLITPDYRVSFANRFFEERFGKSDGRRCYEYLYRRSGPCEDCETLKVLRTGRPHRWEAVEPDGRCYDIHDFPFSGGDGGPLVLEMGLDVTERKRAEAELKQANENLLHAQKMEAVGRLAGGVAHDFNNMMTVVTGYGRRVLRDEGLASAHRAAVEQMAKAGEQAVNLTRQLLAFSRKQIINPVALDLSEAVGEMRKILPSILAEDIELIFELQPGLWPALADPSQIIQVVMNLAANARDAMPTGGRLTVRTANVQAPAAGGLADEDLPPGRYALLSVADTGTGMSEEVREHLFEPFFTTKGRWEGTGLGLSSVYGIVQQSGGHIRVDTAPGRGTAFRLYFPASAAAGRVRPAATAPRSQEAPAPRGSESILLLEDEPSVCGLLTTELQELGYRVLPCRTAGEAIRQAESHPEPIDLLLADVVLPGISGPTLARMFTSRGRVKRVMFMSGHTEKHIVQHGVLVDGVSFIGKPFTTERLAQKIRELLDGGADGL